ncbi:MAG TPA: histidine--tRNA ligase [bacterium]|nr:histidine--tRNA ligase [bacterium]
MARNQFRSPKGIRDVLPEEQPYWQHVESVIRETVRLFGYDRLDLPVFEETALFQRGVGEGTDIVDKEMYTFTDRSDTSITLRPEFTAGTMRAYLQNGMASLPKPVKLWSAGPVFRYERPQAGRFRQHTQFNVEAIGDQDPALDVEIMSVAWHLYKSLGFKNLSFQVNSIGCARCRPGYLHTLVVYYKDHVKEICDDCGKRLQKNPLRLLDCKQDQCQPVIRNAPPMVEMLCQECSVHFHALRTYLDELGRPYQLNNRLVRGLDYYTKTVFEVWAQDIGAQNAVCGGGRYDGLAEVLGGPPTPGVGFASGLERIILTMKEQNVEIPQVPGPRVFLAAQTESANRVIVRMLSDLREAGIAGVMGFGGRSLKARLREANRRGARYVLILGESELSRKRIQIKNMQGGEQREIAFEEVVSFFKEGDGSVSS